MEDSGILTPNAGRYQLRSRTPTTPNTPSTPKQRYKKSTNTPIARDRVKKELITPLKSANNTPKPPSNGQCTPSQSVETPKFNVEGNTGSMIVKKEPLTPLQPVNGAQEGSNVDQPSPVPSFRRSTSLESNGSADGNRVFKTPMAFKPRLVGNKPVPSPSRQEIWKQQLGLTDDPMFQDENDCDKENTTDEDDDDPKCATSQVEYRALQRVLNQKNAQNDESLLQIKNCKDKIRLYKSRLEREENTKRQQLKILKKTHETQLQEKERMIDNLTAIVDEQDERIKDLEETAKSTPRKRGKQAPIPELSVKTSKLIDEIKQLQTEKLTLSTKLNEVQFELTTVREEGLKEMENLKQRVGQTGKGRTPEESSHFFAHNQSVLTNSCTDTEKHVEILQAENDRLFQELTESRNAHTKALTVSKLSGHRQQQLEEELKRYKNQVTDSEQKIKSLCDTGGDTERYEEEILTLKCQNEELQGQVRELQAEIFTLNAKSPEVVKVTKVKEVESEKLKKQHQESKDEVKQLKQKLETERRDLHTAQTQIVYLEKMVNLKETEKSDSHTKLWSELEGLHQEHVTTIQNLKEKHVEEKQEELKKIENRLAYEHKKELHELTETLNKKHSEETEGFMESLESLKNLHRSELAKVEQDRAKKLSDMEKQKSADLQKIMGEQEAVLKTHEVEMKKLREDFEIAKTSALLKLKEELNREAECVLQTERQRLEKEYKDTISELEAKWSKEKEEAVLTVRQETEERMAELEHRFTSIQDRLLLLNPVLSEFVESYILLQKEVKQFPKLIEKTLKMAKKEMTEAILEINEYNKELVTKYHKEMKLRKKYHNELVELKGNIRVFCRVRPVIKEDGQGQPSENIVTLDHDDDGVLHILSKGRTQTFDLDKVFSAESSQEQVFDEVKALATSCVDGYNVCIFAYGQTGSGKTYTMEGTKSNPGINQRALCLLFEEVESRQIDWECTITVSVIEIYNEMIRDLLGNDTEYRMEVKMNPDGGFHIPGLSYVTVSTVDDVNQCFQVGQQNRATASTNMNEHSSRSHCLLCVTVIGVNKTTGVKSTGKLNLVDLAGSERVSKSKADGARLKEAQSINKSLSCLGDVIYALRSKQNYIPYRNSKLTYLLQDSLGGDSKTLMITQIAPVRKNEAETICSLNFAQRVRNVELGAATKRLENGEMSDADLLSSPSVSAVGTPRSNINLGAGDRASPARGVSTPQQSKLTNKPGTPSSTSKLTPVSRQSRKK